MSCGFSWLIFISTKVRWLSLDLGALTFDEFNSSILQNGLQAPLNWLAF